MPLLVISIQAVAEFLKAVAATVEVVEATVELVEAVEEAVEAESPDEIVPEGKVIQTPETLVTEPSVEEEEVPEKPSEEVEVTVKLDTEEANSKLEELQAQAAAIQAELDKLKAEE